jgi:uncharacterized repeat protein (TIGR03803 family)
MNTLASSRFALSVSAAAVLLAACGGSQTPLVAPGAISQASTLATGTTRTNYKVVYSFGGGSDGAHPNSALVNVSGVLYGTTLAGGGGGTVFSITTSGAENVLYSFNGRGHPSGRNPNSMIGADGTLYGTAKDGGSSLQRGTVFSLAPSGAEKLLYAFNGSPDGDLPHGVIDVRGKLYGTTSSGGRYKCGTVFSVSMAGTEHVLHSFLRRKVLRDGCHPRGTLIDVKDTLYGTTFQGGTYKKGTVFAITTGGAERVLHTFGVGSDDGVYPQAGLLDAGGTLYGTTRYTVFSISPSGSLTVLHIFGHGYDGADPAAPLIDVKGTFYGTTIHGGKYCRETANSVGCGTVFSLKPNGTETVLHSFGKTGDGIAPVAGLIDVGGRLYGTTLGGGSNNLGTVFAITP